jgi:hypothetical protein
VKLRDRLEKRLSFINDWLSLQERKIHPFKPIATYEVGFKIWDQFNSPARPGKLPRFSEFIPILKNSPKSGHGQLRTMNQIRVLPSLRGNFYWD